MPQRPFPCACRPVHSTLWTLPNCRLPPGANDPLPCMRPLKNRCALMACSGPAPQCRAGNRHVSRRPAQRAHPGAHKPSGRTWFEGPQGGTAKWGGPSEQARAEWPAAGRRRGRAQAAAHGVRVGVPSEQVGADGLWQAGAVVARGRRRVGQLPAQRAHLVCASPSARPPAGACSSAQGFHMSAPRLWNVQPLFAFSVRRPPAWTCSSA